MAELVEQRLQLAERDDLVSARWNAGEISDQRDDRTLVMRRYDVAVVVHSVVHGPAAKREMGGVVELVFAR